LLDKKHDIPERRFLNIVAIESDTLFIFANIFGVTIEEILEVNPGIVDPDLIFPGQIIVIPAEPPVPPDPGLALAQYLVRPGDSLFFIALRFGLTVDLLVQENPQIVDPNLLFINQIINLLVTPPLPPDPPPGTIQVYVSVTETLITIAERTGVNVQAIIDANPQIVDPDLIFVGQIINVPY